MSKIPANTLALLTCTKCKCYLSRSPVYMTSEGAALCAKCYLPDCLAVQDTLYEAVAKLLLFPCKNAGFGCKKTVPFADHEQATTHDKQCEYNQIVCPLLGPTSCGWFSSQVNLFSHCKQQHRSKILSNPFTLSHNITEVSNEKYLVQALQQLFLLEVEVNIKTGKLNYMMQIFGRTDERNQFKFNLLIKRQNEKLEKECTMALQDRVIEGSLTFNITSLLDVLGGWDDTTFTVILQKNGRNQLKTCSKCNQEVPELCYRDHRNLFCESCAPVKVTCKYNGCYHKDYAIKCQKHEIYFCGKLLFCKICNNTIKYNINSHYNSEHANLKCTAGSKWLLSCTDTWRWFQIGVQWVGLVWCQYKLSVHGFLLRVYTPLSGQQLQSRRCEVQLTDRVTGSMRTYSPDLLYNEIYDWKIDEGINFFSSWRMGLDVVINIT